MFQLQEALENAFLRASEGGHLGTGRRPTENRHERDDQEFTKLMPGVLGAWIGNGVKGGKENLHGEDRLPELDDPLRIHLTRTGNPSA